MLDILSYTFFQRALIAGVLLAISSSYFGVFVVQRKISFIGSGLAHSAFGGAALGLLLHQEPLLIAVPFTLIVALLIEYFSRRTKLSGDSIIGVLFSISVALGIVFLSQLETFSADAMSYLFGSILTIGTSDVYFAVGLLILTILTFFRLWGRWAYATFDESLACSEKLPVQRDNYILNSMIAMTIVISIKIVGILLVTAFLVIPAATSRQISSSFFQTTVISIIISVVSVVAGLFISVAMDIPAGATIILLQAVFFVIASLGIFKNK